MAASFRHNDHGSILLITVNRDGVVRDLSTALSVTLTLTKPDDAAASLTRTPTFVTDGSDGRVRYVFQNGELDTTGRWQFQVNVVFPDGAWSSNIGSFSVLSNL